MKQVVRFKCDFCRKVACRPETIKKHEKVCLKNPNGKNCYMCENAYLGDTDIDTGFGMKAVHSVPICGMDEDMLQENRAPKCPYFKRTSEMYCYRDGQISDLLEGQI
jgi:hypothetical protein